MEPLDARVASARALGPHMAGTHKRQVYAANCKPRQNELGDEICRRAKRIWPGDDADPAVKKQRGVNGCRGWCTGDQWQWLVTNADPDMPAARDSEPLLARIAQHETSAPADLPTAPPTAAGDSAQESAPVPPAAAESAAAPAAPPHEPESAPKPAKPKAAASKPRPRPIKAPTKEDVRIVTSDDEDFDSGASEVERWGAAGSDIRLINGLCKYRQEYLERTATLERSQLDDRQSPSGTPLPAQHRLASM